MRFWQSSIVVVVTMDASHDLHLSCCLLLPRKLLMDLTLACRRSLFCFSTNFPGFFNCGFKPGTNWYNPFIYASEGEPAVIPVVAILYL